MNENVPVHKIFGFWYFNNKFPISHLCDHDVSLQHPEADPLNCLCFPAAVVSQPVCTQVTALQVLRGRSV